MEIKNKNKDYKNITILSNGNIIFIKKAGSLNKINLKWSEKVIFNIGD